MRVVNVGGCRSGQHPFIPDLVGACATPHGSLHSSCCGAVHRILQGEEDRKPAEHAGGVGGGQSGEGDVLVKNTVKISTQTMTKLSRLILTLKCEGLEASVVWGQGGGWMAEAKEKLGFGQGSKVVQLDDKRCLKMLLVVVILQTHRPIMTMLTVIVFEHMRMAGRTKGDIMS